MFPLLLIQIYKNIVNVFDIKKSEQLNISNPKLSSDDLVYIFC